MSLPRSDQAFLRYSLKQNLLNILAGGSLDGQQEASLLDRLLPSLGANYASSTTLNLGSTVRASLRGPFSAQSLPRPTANGLPTINTSDVLVMASLKAESRRLGEMQTAMLRERILANHEARMTQAVLREQQVAYNSRLHKPALLGNSSHYSSHSLAVLTNAVPVHSGLSHLSPHTQYEACYQSTTPFSMRDFPTVRGARTMPFPAGTHHDSVRILTALGTSFRGGQDSYVDASALPVILGQEKQTVRGGVAEPFTQKLYNMLEDVEAQGHEGIISFYPHGRSFAIHDMTIFVNTILPKYFVKQSKMVSFVRQLNLYGFTRIQSGDEAGGYYNDLFLKGRPDLHQYMRRVGASSAGSGQDRRRSKVRYSKAAQPQFDAMKPVQLRNAGAKP